MFAIFSRQLDPISYEFFRPFLAQLDVTLEATASNRDEQSERSSDFFPAVEVDETAEHYVMSVDVPGIARDELNVEVANRKLVISGERKADGRGRCRGKFLRSFDLPDGVDVGSIVAEHKDGVLRLAIRKPAAACVTKIKINDGTTANRAGGFFKSLIADKKAKDAVAINGAAVDRSEPITMAN